MGAFLRLQPWTGGSTLSPILHLHNTQGARTRVEPNTTPILHYAWHRKISPETEAPQVRGWLCV